LSRRPPVQTLGIVLGLASVLPTALALLVQMTLLLRTAYAPLAIMYPLPHLLVAGGSVVFLLRSLAGLPWNSRAAAGLLVLLFLLFLPILPVYLEEEPWVISFGVLFILSAVLLTIGPRRAERLVD
jgi:hypothetical protein